MGPLIDGAAHARMEAALTAAQEQGGTVHGGGRALAEHCRRRHRAKAALGATERRLALWIALATSGCGAISG